MSAFLLFQIAFELRQAARKRTRIIADPAIEDQLNWDGVEEMEFFTADLLRRN